MNANNLTDASLDEAVAVEIFGHSHREVCNACPNGEATSPTTDARDAERVWDWLRERGMTTIERRPNGANASVLVLSQRVVEHGEWKRALCLAALAVARKETR